MAVNRWSRIWKQSTGAYSRQVADWQLAHLVSGYRAER